MESQSANSANALLTVDAGAALLPLLNRILLGDLTASLLHDLNNPLTAILNYARLLQIHPLELEEIETFAKSILVEGERIAALTNRLGALAVAPAPNGRGAKLHEALTFALDLNKTRFRHDGVVIELPAGQNLPNTKLSITSLLQMLLPLLEGARQALNALAPESEKLLRCIVTGTETHQQRLTIAHNGISTPGPELSFLLPFFSNSQRTEQIKIVAEMTQALLHSLNCKITVESPGPGWTALHLDIPTES
jgi:C4-dicarboxylate-specific signal transduction histidine kinase